jgi:hypothetical protein
MKQPYAFPREFGHRMGGASTCDFDDIVDIAAAFVGQICNNAIEWVSRKEVRNRKQLTIQPATL